MWHTLRAELVYLRPYLFGGLGIAAGNVIIVSVVFFAVGESGPPSHSAAGIRGMFFIGAPLIVGFIIQALRLEERRIRLLLAGSLTTRQVVAVGVLLPTILFAIGAFGAGLVMGVEALVTGGFAVESLHIVGYVGGMLFMGLMIGLLVQEATAAYRQQRRRAAVLGWGSFAAVLLFLAAITVAVIVIQGPRSWPILHLGNLLAATTALVASVALFAGRTDFTK